MRLRSLQNIHPSTHQGQLPHLQNSMPVPSLERVLPAGIITGVKSQIRMAQELYITITSQKTILS